jgi:diguanylate cyclase (GGDEF)-like protein/PAS domain S-box-containing protein
MKKKIGEVYKNKTGSQNTTNRRKLAETSQLEIEEKFRTLLENVQEGYFEIDLAGNFTYINDSVCHVLGYSRKELMGINSRKFTDQGDVKKVFQAYNKVYKTEKPLKGFNWHIIRKDSSKRYLEGSISLRKDLSGKPIGFRVIANDFTERKQAEEALQESEARFRDVLENSLDVSYKRNLQTDRYDYLSPTFAKNYGYSLDEMMNLPLEALMDLVHPDDLAEVRRVVAESSSDAVGTKNQMKYRVRHKEGPYRWCHDQFTVMRDADGIPLAIIGSVRDITEQKQAEEALRESEHRYQELSIIDDLTHLYNSRHFYAQMEREIERSNRYEQPLTLMMLDLDKFKDFNDTYGHVEGDQVLLRLGQVIKRCLRETDSAYRYGGEEFMIMLPMTTSEEGIITAKRIQTELMKEAFSPVLGKEVYMTVSIGLAQYKLKEEMKAFVQRIDQLMYQAKKNGRDRICPG